MPGMSVVVVWRRGHAPIRQAVAPVGLAFQIGPVAGRAMLRIKRRAEREFLRIARIGARVVGGWRFVAPDER